MAIVSSRAPLGSLECNLGRPVQLFAAGPRSAENAHAISLLEDKEDADGEEEVEALVWAVLAGRSVETSSAGNMLSSLLPILLHPPPLPSSLLLLVLALVLLVRLRPLQLLLSWSAKHRSSVRSEHTSAAVSLLRTAALPWP